MDKEEKEMKDQEKEKLIDQLIERMTEEELRAAARVGTAITLEIYGKAVNALIKLIEIKKENNNGKG